MNIDCCLPSDYKHDPIKGTLLEEVLNFDKREYDFKIIDELYHLTKNEKKKNDREIINDKSKSKTKINTINIITPFTSRNKKGARAPSNNTINRKDNPCS